MGNSVSSTDNPTKDERADDAEYTDLSATSFFNDDFVGEVYDRLPPFEGTEHDLDVNEVVKPATDVDDVYVRLREIFTKLKYSPDKNISVANYKYFSKSVQTIDNFNFVGSNKMRARLLKRVYIALVREIERSTQMHETTTSRLLDVSEQAVTEDSPDSVLTCVSINLSISMLKSLGTANPIMFRTCCESLLEILKSDSSKVLSKCRVGSVQESTIRAIINYADAYASRTRGSDRSLALGLILATAVSAGSLEDALKVVQQLRRGNEKLSDKSYPFVTRLNDVSADWSLNAPCQESIVQSYPVRSDIKRTAGYLDKPPSFTTDGVFLYIWNGCNGTIHKVGSNFHSSVGGALEAVSGKIELELKDLLGNTIDARLGGPGSYLYGELAWAYGKLYLRMKSFLGPFRIAIISPLTLKVEDIVEIDFAIPEFRKEMAQWKDDLRGIERSKENANVWELGPAINLATNTQGSSIIGASSNYEMACDENVSLLSQTPFQSKPFRFADGDNDQTIIVDLGIPRNITSIGAEFAKPTEVNRANHSIKISDVEGESRYYCGMRLGTAIVGSEDGVCGPSKGPQCPDCFGYNSATPPSPANETRAITGPLLFEVSYDGVDYMEWNRIIIPTSHEQACKHDYVGPSEIRYVRYSFGKCAVSGLGSEIISLTVMGNPKVKKQPWVPYPIMTSTGRLLVFATCKEELSEVVVFFIDPTVSMIATEAEKFVLSLHQTEQKLHQTSLVCNRHNLIFWHRNDFSKRGESETSVEYSVMNYDIETGKKKSQGLALFTFMVSKGFPCSITYDSRNNMIWGYDDRHLVAYRWRNTGVIPHFNPARPEKASQLLISSSPVYRLEALRSLTPDLLDAEAEAAIVMCHLDRLSIQYGPPIDPAAEISLLDELEVSCSANTSPESLSGCRFLLRGQALLGTQSGVNIVVLDENFIPGPMQSFPVGDSQIENDHLATFANNIPDRSIVLVGVCGNGAEGLTSRGRGALSALGAEENIVELKRNDAFAMIGQKDQESVKCLQKIASNGNTATVRRRLPLSAIPLVYDRRASSITTMVEMCESLHESFADNKASVMEKVMLISVLGVITTNISLCIRSMTQPQLIAFFEETVRERLRYVVMAIIDKPQEDDAGMAIAQKALRLFITGLEVLFPTEPERCSLLTKYLQQFSDGSLSDIEKAVLELLIRRMSTSAALARLIYRDAGKGNPINPDDLYKSLLIIAKRATMVKLGNIRVNQYVELKGGVAEAALNMLGTLCNMNIAIRAQTLLAETISAEANSVAAQVIEQFRFIGEVCTELLQAAYALNIEKEGEKGVLIPSIDAVLKSSPVGALLPLMSTSLAILAETDAGKLYQPEILAFMESTKNTVGLLQNIISILPSDQVYGIEAKEISRKVEEVHESAHPYLSNTDTYTPVCYPGAKRITITFSSQSRLENDYDYLIFYKDNRHVETWHPDVSMYTGRDGRENFPGVGNSPSLVIEGDSFEIYFHSDGSGEDWGWQFTASVEYPRGRGNKNIHWLVNVERQLVSMGATFATSFLTSIEWGGDLETAVAPWLEAGFYNDTNVKGSQIYSDNETEALLKGLIDRPRGSMAEALVKRMKEKVPEDRGNLVPVNKVVYGTCAVLIKANNLTYEAASVAKGNRRDITPQLIKVWTAAQKMRAYFDYGDVKSAQGVQNVGGVKLQRTYSGSSSEALDTASEALLERINYLLDSNVCERLDTHINTKQNWKLLAKITQAQATLDKESASSAAKVAAAATEVQNLHKLHSMLNFRRKMAEGKQQVSVTEKVLKFLQSDVSIGNILKVCEVREKRAALRAEGLNFLNHLIQESPSATSLVTVFSAFANSMRSLEQLGDTMPYRHYLHGLDGCDAFSVNKIVSTFGLLYNNFISAMVVAYSNANAASSKYEKDAWRDSVMTALHAIAFDYELCDHDVVQNSHFISCLQQYLTTSDSEIRGVSWALLDVMLPRVVGLIGQNASKLNGPTELSKSLSTLVMTLLEQAANSVNTQAGYSKILSLAMGKRHEIIPGAVSIGRTSPGFVASDIDLGLSHAFSFWIQRKSCDDEEALFASTLNLGAKVCPGPDFKTEPSDSSNDVFSIGTVVEADNSLGKVTVLWSNSIKRQYAFGAVVNGEKKYDVTLANESVGGDIYKKGIPNMMDQTGASAVWSSFGLRMENDASLTYYAASGEEMMFTMRGRQRLPSEKWTHICLVQNNALCRLFVNGKLDSEALMDDHMLHVGRQNKYSFNIESPHPYRDDTDDYTVMEVPGAISYTITFDSRSATETTYDFIRFYKDDSHTDYYGEEKYTGRSGEQNFPGFSGRPPLVIRASRFIIYFHSDQQINDWGYKFMVKADMKTDDYETNGDPSIGNGQDAVTLNASPIYVGQPPSYIATSSSAAASICSFNVFEHSLSAREIGDLVIAAPANQTSVADSKLCLDVLSVIQRSCSLPGDPMVQPFASPSCLTNLLSLMKNGTSLVKLSATRVAASIFPKTDPNVINTQAKSAGLLTSSSNFVEFLVQSSGRTYNFLSKFSGEKVVATTNNEFEFAIATEISALLRALTTSPGWQDDISKLLSKYSQLAPKVVGAVEAQAQADCEENEPATSISPALISDLNNIYGILAIFGGHLSAVNTGSTALYHGGSGVGNGIVEECTIVAPCWPPILTRENEATWSGLGDFGDAVYVVMHSRPKEMVLLPRNKIAIKPTDNVVDMTEFINKNSDPLIALLRLISTIDATDPRPQLLPRVEEFEEIAIYESSHPYQESQDQYTHMKFPGAKQIVIEFDVKSRTVLGSDYVRFYKDESHVEYYGDDSYSGDPNTGEHNWPGLDGLPCLTIESDSCVLYFHTDSATENNWGYKFKAIANCRTTEDPPQPQPVLHISLLASIKLAGLKAFKSLLTNVEGFIPRSIPLLQPLVTSSNYPLPKLGNLISKTLVFESEHPYGHNMNEYVTISIKGAKSLVITFDEMSATESGCDYLRFYKDDTHQAYWGAGQYSGGQNGSPSNFPGCKGREPLHIPATSCVMYFYSDSSVNDWGYKFHVQAGGAMEGQVTDDLCSVDYSSFCLQQVIADGCSSSPCNVDISRFELDNFSNDHIVDASNFVIQANTIMNESSDNLQEPTYVGEMNQLYVNPRDTTIVNVHETMNVDSPILGTIETGNKIIPTSESGDWVTIQYETGEGKVTGHVLRRFGDQIYLISSKSAQPDVVNLKQGPPVCARGHAMVRTVGIPSTYSAMAMQYLTVSCDSCGQQHIQNATFFHHCAQCKYDICEGCAPDDLVCPPVINTTDDEDALVDITSNENSFELPSNGINSSLYGLVDRVVPDKNDGTTLFSPSSFLRGKGLSLQALASNYTFAGTILYSRDCINTILKNWPREAYLAPDSFGTTSAFFTFLKAVYIAEEKDGVENSEALKTLKKSIQEIIRGKKKQCVEFCDALIGFSTQQIIESLKFLTTMKRTKAKVRVVESKHPYADNTEDVTPIHIPGAKYLKIIFDRRSATEADCDYIDIWKDETSYRGKWNEQTYSGRKQSQCFAGVGDVPPCIVKSDKCWVNFHSDGSNNDWGFKLICYGIMEEADQEQHDEEIQMLNSFSKMTNLACWTLEILCKERSSEILSKIFFPKHIRAFRRYLEIVPWGGKLNIIYLIIDLANQINEIPVNESTTIELDALKRTLISLMKEKYHLEGISTNRNRPTRVLQSLVEVVIVMDIGLSNKILKGKSITDSRFGTSLSNGVVVHRRARGENNSEKVYKSKQTMENFLCWLPSENKDINIETSDGRRTVRYGPMAGDGKYRSAMCKYGYESGLNLFHLKVNSFTDTPPIIGIALPSASMMEQIGSNRFSIGWGGQNLYVNGAAAVPFGPKVVTGDLLSVEVNLIKGTISFYRNEAFVGLAVGPPKSGASMELTLGKGPYHPVVSLWNLGDSVTFTVAPTSPDLQTPSDKLLPSWFMPLKESVALVRSCAMRELPTSVIENTFVPQCSEKTKMTIETSHPYEGESIDQSVSIDGAESLNINIDRATRMGADDIVKFSYQDVDGVEKSHELIGLDGGVYSTSKSLSSSITVGDRVVRGPSWDWGHQDGGAGSFGEVMAIKDWKGKEGSGVRVVWKDSGFEGLYRWDFEGSFDIKVIGAFSKNTNPLIIPSNKVRVTVTSVSGEPSSLYGFRCIVRPTYNTSTVMTLPFFKSDFERLRSEYSIGTLAHDAALISYVDSVAISKSISREKLLRCSWDDISPTEATLSAMPLLRELITMSVRPLPYSAVSVPNPYTILPRINGSAAPADPENEVSTTILFQLPTTTDMRVKIFWLNGQGELIVYNELGGAGNEYEQYTFVGHIWVVQHGQRELGRYQATKVYGVVRIPEISEDEKKHAATIIDDLQQTPKCLQGHEMEIFDDLPPHYEDDSDVFCDSCKEPSIHEHIFFYNCKHCNYDLCGNCIPEACLPKPRCLAKHRMVRLSDYQYPQTVTNPNPQPPTCDVCHTHDLPNVYSFFYHCEPCMHDLCPVCAIKASPMVKDQEISANAENSTVSKVPSNMKPVNARLQVLLMLNKSLEKALPFFDLALRHKPGTASYQLAACRGLIFSSLKNDLWDRILEETESSGEEREIRLELSRYRAVKHGKTGLPDVEGTRTCFSQAFRQLHNLHPRQLRRSNQIYEVFFAGEQGQDVGGLYRESFALYCSELQSTAMDLLIPTPNSKHSFGQNRDRWILNPGANLLIHREMHVFLGKLIGVAVRGKEYLNLNMPSIVWKKIVDDVASKEDLVRIDQFQMISLDKLKDIDKEGVDASTFSDVFFESFTAISSDNRLVDLIPHGGDTNVTYENRLDYCESVVNFRLHEIDDQAKAIREGISMVLPLSLLSLYAWDQFERLVCGNPIIDINLLRSATEYSQCSASDRHVDFFWRAMEEFSQEERSTFLRFVWGRSRLPLNLESFNQKFKIQSFQKSPADSYFPLAHTCFFSLELPSYSSLEIMKNKLRYAIFNCQSIDGDDAGVAVAVSTLDWDE